MSETATVLVVLAGAFDLGFAAFHLGFPWIFKWRERLASLDNLNRSIVYVLNWTLALVFAMAGYWLVSAPDFFLGNFIAQDFLKAAALFWIIRALVQPIYFDFRHWASVSLFIVFITGAILHFSPLYFLPPTDCGEGCGGGLSN